MDKIIDIHTKRPAIITDTKSFNFEREFGDDGGGLWDAEYQAQIDSMALKGMFFNEPWPFIALDLVADSLSQVPMIVKKTITDGDGDTTEEIVKEHPVLKILENPNPMQNYSQWMYNLEIEIDLMGNGIIYYAKNKQQLYIIPAETITLDFNGSNLFAYRVHEDLGNGMTKESGQTFAVKDIWHYRRPNPKSLFWGLSPFIPNRKPVLLNRYSLDWVLSFYLKGATPNVIIQSEKPNVDEKRALRFLRSFEQAHTGRANYRRPLVVPNGYKAEMMNQSIADQNFIDLVKLNREDILQILRIPKHAVGLAESGSLGSEEHKQALKFFYTDSITPRQNKISQFLTSNFREQLLLAEDEHLEFDNSKVGILQEDLHKQAELAQALMPIWSLNEIRSEIFQKEPLIEGESVATTPSQSGILLGNGQAPIEEEEAQLVQDEEIIEEDDDDDDIQDKDFRESVNKRLVSKFGNVIIKNLEDQVDILENEGENLNDYVGGLLDKWIDGSIDVVVKELRKGQAKNKDVGDNETPKRIPSKKRLRGLLTKFFDKDEDEYMGTTITEMGDIPGKAFDATILGVTKPGNEDILEALKSDTEEKTRKLMQARGLTTFKNISETTTDKIFTTIENGIKNGRTIDEISIDLAESKDLNISRAKTIARTEVLTASSLGQKATMDSTAEVIEDLVKIWISAKDLRVRGRPTPGLYPDAKDNHWTLSGEVRDVKDVYSNGLDYPRDPKGEGYKTINCRCTQAIVSKQDLEDEDIEDFKN